MYIGPNLTPMVSGAYVHQGFTAQNKGRGKGIVVYGALVQGVGTVDGPLRGSPVGAGTGHK